MARNTYVLIPTNKSDAPRGGMLKIRNASSRNLRRLNKRLARFNRVHGSIVTHVLDNGTLVAVTSDAIETWTVKRDAERAARKTGRMLITL